MTTESKNLPALKTENIQEAEVLTEVPTHVQIWLNENKNFVLIQSKQLKLLLDQLDEANAERKILIKTAFAIMGLFGYLDKEGKPIPEIMSGEESFVPGMLKSLADVVALLTKTKMAITKNQRAQYEAQLVEKFKFVHDLLPLIVKYSSDGN